jgi:hypothetical protein
MENYIYIYIKVHFQISKLRKLSKNFENRKRLLFSKIKYLPKFKRSKILQISKIKNFQNLEKTKFFRNFRNIK